jgi:hypothetical protein
MQACEKFANHVVKIVEAAKLSIRSSNYLSFVITQELAVVFVGQAFNSTK